MFSEDVKAEIARAADETGLEAAALLAVAEVESGGRAFAEVDGRREPLIRFEGHYFDRRLSGPERARARRLGLAAPRAGVVANPPSQEGRWALLRRAAAIDAAAAYESVSWGLGQVMGAHWRMLGFESVGALVEEARSGAAGQARLMANFIRKTGLAAALEAHDWAAFACGYNGPLYARNAYDAKMAAAFGRYGGADGARPAPEPAQTPPPLLLEGCSGPPVMTLQRVLAALGYDIAADGIYGPATAAAVKAFQRSRHLDDDGIAGPRTLAALAAMEVS